MVLTQKRRASILAVLDVARWRAQLSARGYLVFWKELRRAHEEDVPAQHTEAEEDARVPGADANSGWSGCAGPTAAQGPASFDRLKAL